MGSNTYASSTLTATLETPTENTLAAMLDLTFVAGDCALHNFPGLGREWAKVTETLVCQKTNTDKKGSSKWKPMTLKLSRRPGDALQTILRTLEDSNTAVGTIRLTLPEDQGSAFVQVQVSMFDYFEGGGQDDYIAAPVEFLIQQAPVIATPAEITAAQGA